MDLPISKQRKILHFDGQTIQESYNEIVTEYALTIFVNEEEFATLVCTPKDMEELVIGFLASEGMIREASQIQDLTIDYEQGFAYVTTVQQFKFNQQFYNKRYITSCCGKGRQSFYFYNDAHTAKEVTSESKISIEDAFRLLDSMQERSVIFKNTGGVHNAALCGPNGVLVDRTDIGRHNALDKIYGYCLRNDVMMGDKIIAFSGRISSEIVLKVSKIGVGIILSKSAPTELALDMAEQLGITVIGFIRGTKLNIYTHPERITQYQND